MNHTIAILIALLLGTVAQAGELKPERTLYIEGAISFDTLSPLFDKVEALTKEAVTNKNKDTINIIISSPGGEVISGNMFINRLIALKGLGVDVDCYVQDMAASMAFQLLTQCSNRYALDTSYLLWHGVRTQMRGPITSLVAASLLEDLEMMDEAVMIQLEGALALKPNELTRHFERETLWTGQQLRAVAPGFMSVSSDYPEVTRALTSKKVTRSSAVPSFFGSDAGIVDRPAFYLIWDRYFYLLNLGTRKEGK